LKKKQIKKKKSEDKQSALADLLRKHGAQIYDDIDKGNYPNKCSLQAAYLNKKISDKNIVNRSKKWKLLLNKVKLHAHKKHNFQNKLMKNKKINYIRINIFPDGGISRIRAFGRVE